MADSHQKDVTQLLLQWRGGDKQAVDELMPLVYQELRRLASAHLRRERPDHTLQSTALVNEAYLRLIDQRSIEWQSRAHFFGLASQMIRRILVDHARGRSAAKRGSGACKLVLDESIATPGREGLDLAALDDALTSLAAIDPQQSRIVEMRFFGGLSVDETAEVLGISPATLYREWGTARAWLFREMSGRRSN
jgi:RNA polymerase sigma factor (TIGR02999 family)